ncbi:hypothetical protein K439DRAFT_1362482 [Ramaria rubella]|nr:hypothetical protein K439DRAFT_1362482 [Ramaria rubella]
MQRHLLVYDPSRDILCIPGVSVSIKQLFSNSKNTLQDTRCSMIAITTSKTIIMKDQLKHGLREGIYFL